MYLGMSLEDRRACKRLTARAALKWPLACVNPAVVFEMVAKLERLLAPLAEERSVTLVDSHVLHKCRD